MSSYSGTMCTNFDIKQRNEKRNKQKQTNKLPNNEENAFAAADVLKRNDVIKVNKLNFNFSNVLD